MNKGTGKILKKATFMFVMLCALSACNQLTKEAKDTKDAAQRAQYDLLEEWRDLLIYDPPSGSQLAQRRYCYKQMMDIVCYDAPQRISSPLIGAQEGLPGRLVPGKAALEAYEAKHSNVLYQAEPASAAPIGVVQVAPPAPIEAAPIDLSASTEELDVQSCDETGPFACGESAHVKQP